MLAKHVILIATGKGKAQTIRDTIKGTMTPMVPASILRVHPNVQFLLDEDAASLL
jgi:glucosamine-6-phosphate deaminase